MTSDDKRDTLPPLRDVIAAHDLSASKRFGQNFLLDLNITTKIARAAGPLDDAIVWEVGPGPGGLTRALLSEGAAKVIAVERDPRFAPALDQLQAAYPDRLEVVNADALEVDEKTFLSSHEFIVVANLPFNIATPLLLKWLFAKPWPPWFERLTLMFQKEVAERICAEPSTKAYGRLSVISQWRCEVQRLFDVPARAFTPSPKVGASVVQLSPRPDRNDHAIAEAIEHVARAAFGQRRKMLRASLRTLHPDAELLLTACGIDPKRRAETLSILEFEQLARALNQPGQTSA